MKVRHTILALLASCGLAAGAAGEGLGTWAVDFGAVTIDGKASIDLSESFKGKLVLMDFWATWCEPCMEEVPGLVAAWKKYGSGKIAFLGVTLDTPSELKKVQATMAKMGMTWPQVFDDGSDADGKGTTISAAYKVEGIPAPFLIDADTGRIVARDSELRGDRLQKTLEAALKAKK
jgi:thiol-disulfide isomerase/thioredoxin